MKDRAKELEYCMTQTTQIMKEKLYEAVTLCYKDKSIAETRKKLDSILSKLESEVVYRFSDPFSQDKLNDLHLKTMKLIELDDLQLQTKLSLDDKELLISTFTKLKQQVDDEDGFLGRLFSREPSDKQEILTSFDELWKRRLSQIEQWFRKANATAEHNSSIYLDGEIHFNFQDESILKETMVRYREIFRGPQDSPGSSDSTLTEVNGCYKRLIQLSTLG